MNDSEPWVFLPKQEPFADTPPETAWDVIRLWEVRRLRLNLVLLAVFAAGWVAVTTFYAIFLRGGLADTLQAGLIVATGIVYFLLVINLCFTVGWISELLVRAAVGHKVDRYGPVAYKVLVAMSIAAIPILLIWHLLMTLTAIFN